MWVLLARSPGGRAQFYRLPCKFVEYGVFLLSLVSHASFLEYSKVYVSPQVWTLILRVPPDNLRPQKNCISCTHVLIHECSFRCLHDRYAPHAAVCFCLSAWVMTCSPAVMGSARFAQHSASYHLGALVLRLCLHNTRSKVLSHACEIYSSNISVTTLTSHRSLTEDNRDTRNDSDSPSDKADSKLFKPLRAQMHLWWASQLVMGSHWSSGWMKLLSNENEMGWWSDSGYFNLHWNRLHQIKHFHGANNVTTTLLPVVSSLVNSPTTLSWPCLPSNITSPAHLHSSTSDIPCRFTVTLSLEARAILSGDRHHFIFEIRVSITMR